MRILHTADLHLGKPYGGLGAKGAVLRDAQMQTLKRIVKTATAREVDAVVVAGDLFDSNLVSGSLTRGAVSEFARLGGRPVFLLPGTHDILDEDCLYHRREFGQTPNVSVFGIDGDAFEVGDAVIHGFATRSKGRERPLRALSLDPEAKLNVAAVHGSMKIASKSNPEDNLITTEDIARGGWDYVCLGHWHTYQDFSVNGVSANYPGAPEQLKFSESGGAGAGSVLIVDIDDSGARVEPVQVGRFTWLEKTIDLTKFPPGPALDAEIEAAAGAEVLLRVKFAGVLARGVAVDAREYEEKFAEDFFHIEVDTSKVGFQLDDVEGLFPKGTVGALYVERLRRRIKKTKNAEERERLEEALHRGAGLLAGELEVS